MSGGHFNYSQHFINDIADEIEYLIERNGSESEWGDFHREVYSKVVINEFRKAVKVLRKAYVYAHRIDWFLSGDDGEETFHERLKEDLEKLK